NRYISTILRSSPSGSSTIRQRLPKTIVWQRVGSLGVHVNPGWLGLPVRAKLTQAVAIFLASACASGVLPVPCSQRFVLSKQNASSAVCHARFHCEIRLNTRRTASGGCSINFGVTRRYQIARQ